MRLGINRLVGTKKLPAENGMLCALRSVRERLPQLEGHLKFDFAHKECFEDEEDSPSYPGVRTVYRKEIYEGIVNTRDSAKLEKMGLSEKCDWKFSQADDKEYTRFMEWLSDEVCKE